MRRRKRKSRKIYRTIESKIAYLENRFLKSILEHLPTVSKENASITEEDYASVRDNALAALQHKLFTLEGDRFLSHLIGCDNRTAIEIMSCFADAPLKTEVPVTFCKSEGMWVLVTIAPSERGNIYYTFYADWEKDFPHIKI